MVNYEPELTLYTRIRKFFQPYYNPKPDLKKIEKMKAEEAAKKAEAEKEVIARREAEAKEQEAIRKKQEEVNASREAETEDVPTVAKPKQDQAPVIPRVIGDKVVDEVVKTPPKKDSDSMLPISNYPKPLDKAILFNKKPSLGHIWAYHDDTRHQLIAHLQEGTGFDYLDRDDEKRIQTRAVIYPMGVKFDRTHMIPFGYHNSETDQRLIIGWLPEHNQNEMMEFEKKQKLRKHNIYWHVDIRKFKGGLRWVSKIYHAETLQLLDKLVLDMNKAVMWSDPNAPIEKTVKVRR